MAEKRFADALNEQIANEFAASQQYVGAAVYYDVETLPRLAAFFYRQALEEREHAMMMIQYLLDVGEAVHIPDIKAQETATPTAVARCEWHSNRRSGSARRSSPSSSWRARSRTTAPSSSCSGSSRSRSRRWR